MPESELFSVASSSMLVPLAADIIGDLLAQARGVGGPVGGSLEQGRVVVRAVFGIKVVHEKIRRYAG